VLGSSAKLSKHRGRRGDEERAAAEVEAEAATPVRSPSPGFTSHSISPSGGRSSSPGAGPQLGALEDAVLAIAQGAADIEPVVTAHTAKLAGMEEAQGKLRDVTATLLRTVAALSERVAVLEAAANGGTGGAGLGYSGGSAAMAALRSEAEALAVLLRQSAVLEPSAETGLGCSSRMGQGERGTGGRVALHAAESPHAWTAALTSPAGRVVPSTPPYDGTMGSPLSRAMLFSRYAERGE
jgi:hypothetical protein